MYFSLFGGVFRGSQTDLGDSDESGSDFFLGDSDEDEGAATDCIGLSNSIRGDVELSDVERAGRESTD